MTSGGQCVMMVGAELATGTPLMPQWSVGS